MRIAVRVVPKSSRRGIVGVVGERLKVALHAAPEKGKANRELLELLAETLDCPARCLSVVAGHTSRDKTLEVHGADSRRLAATLTALIKDTDS
ncbi:DUF167 domain-containing protein [bacterium]|nr:DUF167 domain-containing protein [bacterium]